MRVRYAESWSTPMAPADVRLHLRERLAGARARIRSDTDSEIVAVTGRVLNTMFRQPVSWAARVSIEVERRDEGGALVRICVEDNMPLGTRVGSERSYANGLRSLAESIRANLEIADLASHGMPPKSEEPPPDKQ